MKLEFINGPQAGHEIELIPPFVKIGRELDNNISILSGGLSRYHATFSFKNDVWHLEDLNSTNGTFVNKKRILVGESVEIHFGDVLTFSDQVMKVQAHSSLNSIIKEPDSIQTPPPAGFQLNLIQQEAQTPVIQLTPHHMTAHPAPVIVPVVTPPDPIVETQTQVAPIIDLSHLSAETLFTGSDHAKKSNIEGQSSTGQSFKFNSRLMNIILISVGIIGVFVVLGIIISLDRTAKDESNNVSTVAKSQTNLGVPLTMHFERQKEIDGNLFRFEFRIEFGQQVRVRLFDMKSGVRHDTKFSDLVLKLTTVEKGNTSTLDGETLHAMELKDLVSRINESGIFETEENVLATKGNDYYYVNICSGTKQIDLIEYSNAPPRSIELLEEAVAAFSLSVLKLAFTRPFEEIRAESERMYQIAEDRFNNSEGSDGNLKDAIKSLKYIIGNLQVFDPKPPTYKMATELLQKAEKKRSDKIDEFRFASSQALNLKEYSRALELQNRVINFIDKDDNPDLHERTQRNIKRIHEQLQNQLTGGGQ